MPAPDRPFDTFSRRRPNRSQGQALEALGHAIEYLIDNHLLDTESEILTGEEHAIQLLSDLSRAVFMECSPSISFRQQLALGFRNMLYRVTSELTRQPVILADS